MLQFNLLPGAIRHRYTPKSSSLFAMEVRLSYLPIFQSNQPQMNIWLFFLLIAMLGAMLGVLASELSR